jgi:hypothetical protein
MLGCLFLGLAGVFLATRMFHRHHYGWHHRRWAHCGAGWHGHMGGHHGGFGGHGWGPGGGGHDGDEGGGWGDEPRSGFMGGSWGRGFVVRRLSEALDATPAQEKVIRAAAEEFNEAAAKLRGEGKRTRADVAAAFRKASFDEVMLGELYARHDRSLEEVRKAFVGMGAKIHDVLDDGQRERLAAIIEEGPRAWMRRGWGRPRA